MSGLYSVKPWFLRRLRRVEDALVERGVSPDSLTVASVGVSVAAGAALAAGGAMEEPLLWLLVPPLGLVRLALNALDGAVARRNGGGRPFGEVMNEMGDRLSDVALLAPLAFVVEPVLAFGAVTCALLASAAGSAARTVAGERLSGGPMGKADRVAVVSLAALAAGIAGTPRPLEVAVWIVAAGSLLTMALRVAALARREVAADVRR